MKINFKDYENIKDGRIFPSEVGEKGYSCKYYIAYIPKNIYGFDLNKNVVYRRNMIYSIKDGSFNLEKLATKILFDIDENIKNDSNYYFCVIPASTIVKNYKRFYRLCSLIAEKSNIQNGYELIQIIKDREELKYSTNRKKFNIWNNLKLNNVDGKKIILFDDLFTTGTSFYKIAYGLESK